MSNSARRELAAGAVVLGVVVGASLWALGSSPSVSPAILLAQEGGRSTSPTDRSSAATREQGSTAPVVDLSRERSWIGDAREALNASDSETARTIAAEAVTALLARPESERGDAWLELLDSAGRLAWEAHDPGTARAAWEQGVEVRARTLPPEHGALQAARLSLASALRVLGELDAARALQEQVLEIRERTLPSDAFDLHLARGNLAETLCRQGDLATARAMQEEVLAVRARTLPAEHPALLAALSSLADTLCLQGDPSAARVLYEQVLEVCSRTLPPDHPSLQRTRHNLAVTFVEHGDLAAARALEEQVLEAFERTLSPDHHDLQVARMNLAGRLHMLGEFHAARALEEKALEVLTLTLPAENPDLQRARLNLAETLRVLGDPDAALALQEVVLEVFSRTLPPEHPDLQAARLNLAITCARLGAMRRAEEGDGAEELSELRGRCTALVNDLARSATHSARIAMLSSSREAEERCASLQWVISSSLSFAAGFGCLDPEPGLTRAAFVLSETTRASGLASASIARMARSDERYGKLREEIRSAGRELARLVQSGGTRAAYDAVIAERDRAQSELVRLASGSAQTTAFLAEADPEALAARLGPSDAIVAYRRYMRSEFPPGGTQVRATASLCAFVVRKGEGLQCVELGAIGPIEAAVEEWRDALGIAEGRGVGVVADSGDSEAASRRARSLCALVFDPLLPSLDGARHLVLVLDDVLQAVPIDALPALVTGSSDSAASPEPTDAVLLGDLHDFELRGTLQEFSASDAPLSDAGLVVVIGGADYSAAPGIHAADADQEIASAQPIDSRPPSAPSVPGLLRGSAWADGFTALPGTFDEARGVTELTARGGIARDTVLLERSAASRASIEELAPRARFLHLATHGWFAPESVRSWSDPAPPDDRGEVLARMDADERVKGSSPMLLCGLALAGANLPADALGRFPGLVTAEEISGWDLARCELAVLSACDTARGELRRSGQGVASLQKALHMAGARTVITSLWKVPDEATKELMLDFYRRIWIEKQPKAQALWEAKRRLRDAKDESGRPRYSTRDWAAWVLTGDPR